jgi:hypothetical protein
VNQIGADDASAGGPLASNDQQIVRFSDGSILLMHQGVRRDPGSSGACSASGATCRGVEYFFRSTDCGATWSFVSILDPKTDGPQGDPSRYYATTTQLGHDRPEIYVDPFNPSRVYVTVIGWGDSVSTMVLYRSDDRGTSWSHAGELPSIWTPAGMTNLSSTGLLYVAGWYGVNPDGSSNLGIVTYNPTTNQVVGPLQVANNVFRLPGFAPWGSEGISRVESTSAGDTVRVHHTYKTSSGDFGLAVRTVRVSGASVNQLSNDVIPPAAGKSFAGVTLVDTDHLEFSGTTNGQMLYWYEVDTTPTSGDFGPARVLYRYWLGTSQSGAVGCMSLTGSSSCRTWPIAQAVYGDYQKGAFWRDGANGLNFLALWGEQASSTSTSMKTNVLRLQQGPCDSFCANPQNVTWSGSYQSGALGTGAICRETTQPVVGGNCGNFASGRQLSVNGVQMPCNNTNWSAVPPSVNGGYCIQTTAGNYPWAFFTLW